MKLVIRASEQQHTFGPQTESSSMYAARIYRVIIQKSPQETSSSLSEQHHSIGQPLLCLRQIIRPLAPYGKGALHKFRICYVIRRALTIAMLFATSDCA